MGSVLCFLGYLLSDFKATLFRAADEDFFRVFCVLRGLNFRAPREGPPSPRVAVVLSEIFEMMDIFSNKTLESTPGSARGLRGNRGSGGSLRADVAELIVGRLERMDYYSARLLIVCLVDDGRPRKRMTEQATCAAPASCPTSAWPRRSTWSRPSATATAARDPAPRRDADRDG